MSAGWTLSVDAEALRFLLAARGNDRRKVLDGVDHLVAEPHQPCDFTRRSPNQRDYGVKVMSRVGVTSRLEPEKIFREVRTSRICPY